MKDGVLNTASKLGGFVRTMYRFFLRDSSVYVYISNVDMYGNRDVYIENKDDAFYMDAEMVIRKYADPSSRKQNSVSN